MKNPLSNAHLIGANYNPREYQMKGKRGEASYIMSRSSLKDFADCPSRWIRGGEMKDEETSSTIWGSLVDCVLTQPGRLDDLFAIKPDTYTNDDGEEKPWNANSKTCRAWINQNEGRTCISQDFYLKAQRAVAQLLPKVGGLGECDFQVYLKADYRDKETGLVIPICALIDLVPKEGRSIADLKTARNANPTKWARVCHDYWYDAQAALYLDSYNAATGEDRDQFEHIIQENEQPFEIALATLSVEFINQGRRKYTNALRLYAQCLKSGHWASYNDLALNNYNGRVLVEPENWMIESQNVEDPDWMSDKEAA